MGINIKRIHLVAAPIHPSKVVHLTWSLPFAPKLRHLFPSRREDPHGEFRTIANKDVAVAINSHITEHTAISQFRTASPDVDPLPSRLPLHPRAARVKLIGAPANTHHPSVRVRNS